MLQWGALAGLAQSATKAEDVAAMAAMLAPSPTSLAGDNQGTVDFIQGVARGGQGAGKRQARTCSHAARVRTAMLRKIRDKGPGAVSALKVKAHVEAADPMAEVIAPRAIRNGNGGADNTTARRMLEHPAGDQGLPRGL